jgi:hypothetical protein
MKQAPLGDGWYESEEPTRLGMIAELQRIQRRTRARPIPVLLLAILVTAGVTYKFANKPKLYEANVVLALDEGPLASTKHAHIPFNELKAYVGEKLLSDEGPLWVEKEKRVGSLGGLTALIEEHNLYPLRKKLGMKYAIGELRESLEIEIWKNSFVFYDEADERAKKSARIGLTVADFDPDDAYETAHGLAMMAIAVHDSRLRKVSSEIAVDVDQITVSMEDRLEDLEIARNVKQAALIDAQRDRDAGLAGTLMSDLAAISAEEKKLTAELKRIITSPDAAADQITAAGLNTGLAIVEERHPERNEHSAYVLAMIIVVIGTGALLGAALFVGAFDPRVHDVDDVQRLGLPILGHVPGFQGDRIGSLSARGATRGRVPSFLRWRFLR